MDNQTLKNLDLAKRQRALDILASAPTAVPDREAEAVERQRGALRRELSGCIDTILAKNAWQAAEESLTTLLRLVSNLMDHPSEPKYASVSTASKVYATTIASRPGAEEFLLAIGFGTVVSDMREMMTYNAAAAAARLPPRHMVLAREVLAKALNERLVRLHKQPGPVNFGLPTDDATRRQEVLRDFEDDRLERMRR